MENERIINIQKFWEEIGDKLNEISNEIDKNEGGKLSNFYNEIDNVADQIRDKIKDISNFGKMPVPITKMAEELGISVGKFSLTYEQQNDRRRITQLRMKDNPIIFVDSEASEAEVRYAIAFEIGHFISWYRDDMLKQGIGKKNHAYTLIPMISHGATELIADALAISLLVPFQDFCEEFYNYIMENRKKQRFIRTEEWLEYLAERAGISFSNMAIGYQQLRYIALREEKRKLVLDEEKWKIIRPDDD